MRELAIFVLVVGAFLTAGCPFIGLVVQSIEYRKPLGIENIDAGSGWARCYGPGIAVLLFGVMLLGLA